MTTMYSNGMNEQEIAIFEQQCRSRGYNTRKEGNRYCEHVVNEMLQAVAAFKQTHNAFLVTGEEPFHTSYESVLSDYLPT